MNSVIQYIQKLLNDFITAFIVFLTILSLAALFLIFIGFRVLRKSMWDTNIILKIIPFETLPKKDRIDIKDFFNSWTTNQQQQIQWLDITDLVLV